MRILVTGGAGYLGSTLVPRLLEKGHAVRVLDNLCHGGKSLLGVWSHPRFEFRRGDVRGPEAREALRGIEAVVHLAAIVGDPACSRQPDLARAVNLQASLDLFRASQESGVQRFTFASTCSNYGKMKDPDQYLDENGELSPVSLYAETKVQVEQELLKPRPGKSICATPLRFATLFGVSPRMRFDLTVNEFPMEMLTKKRLVVFGEKFWRPYLHVRDAAAAIQAVLEAPADKVRDQVFNVGATEQNYQKQQLVDMIRPHVPDAVVDYVQKQEDPRDYRVSFEKIKRALNYGVTRSVEDGIREVLDVLRSGTVDDVGAPHYRN